MMNSCQHLIYCLPATLLLSGSSLVSAFDCPVCNTPPSGGGESAYYQTPFTSSGVAAQPSPSFLPGRQMSPPTSGTWTGAWAAPAFARSGPTGTPFIGTPLTAGPLTGAPATAGNVFRQDGFGSGTFGAGRIADPQTFSSPGTQPRSLSAPVVSSGLFPSTAIAPQSGPNPLSSVFSQNAQIAATGTLRSAGQFSDPGVSQRTFSGADPSTGIGTPDSATGSAAYSNGTGSKPWSVIPGEDGGSSGTSIGIAGRGAGGGTSGGGVGGGPGGFSGPSGARSPFGSSTGGGAGGFGGGSGQSSAVQSSDDPGDPTDEEPMQIASLPPQMISEAPPENPNGGSSGDPSNAGGAGDPSPNTPPAADPPTIADEPPVNYVPPAEPGEPGDPTDPGDPTNPDKPTDPTDPDYPGPPPVDTPPIDTPTGPDAPPTPEDSYPGGVFTDPDLPDGGIPDVVPAPPHCGNPNGEGGPIPDGSGNDTPVVPEPTTLLMLAMGSVLGGGHYLRRRRKITIESRTPDRN